MICVCLITLLGLSWMFLPCKGQISVTSNNKNIKILQGKDLEIIWNVSGIEASDLDLREWKLLRIKEILAQIKTDDKVIINNGTILAQGFEVRKPSTLYLKSVDERYDGRYEFAITEGFDSHEFVVTVSVLRKPIITTSCSNVTTMNRSDNFACECKGLNGRPRAVVTWYNSSGPIVTGIENVTLVLRNVSKNDNGTYRCEAKSDEDAKDDKSIELIVNHPPENVNLTRSGRSATITCGADGEPAPHFEIFLNETTLIKSGRTFTIPAGNTSYVGYYKCVAENILGNASSDPEYIFIKAPTTMTPSQTKGTGTPPRSGPTGEPTRHTADKKTTTPTTPTTPSPRHPCRFVPCILLIIIGVLMLILIIAALVYYRKKRARNGYKGNANVNPDDGRVVVNQYELEEDNAYDSVKGDNAYDSVKGDNAAYDPANSPGSSASTSKPPKDTMPPVYAAVDKNNREGKTLYATLDSVALESDGSQKRKDDRPPPTEYADINFLKKEPEQNAGEAV